MKTAKLNLRKVVAIAICLAGVFSANNVLAQDHVTYLGTVTATANVYQIGDINNVNTEIQNQELFVDSNEFGFVPNLPLYKDGEVAHIILGTVTFEPNGHFSAPERGYDNTGMTFTDISGNISGNTINLTFRILDTATGGTLLDAVLNYTGTKQTSEINIVSTVVDKNIVGYYSIIGQNLNKEPQSGFYIVVYDNGTSEKIMR